MPETHKTKRDVFKTMAEETRVGAGVEL